MTIIKRLLPETVCNARCVLCYLQIEELAPLGSLHEYLITKGKTLSVRLFHSYACQIANAMKYLEERRIVHRDLAARNILLVAEDYVSDGWREGGRDQKREGEREGGIERGREGGIERVKEGGREGGREGGGGRREERREGGRGTPLIIPCWFLK